MNQFNFYEEEEIHDATQGELLFEPPFREQVVSLSLRTQKPNAIPSHKASRSFNFPGNFLDDISFSSSEE